LRKNQIGDVVVVVVVVVGWDCCDWSVRAAAEVADEE
jgi:hypothetical protein